MPGWFGDAIVRQKVSNDKELFDQEVEVLKEIPKSSYEHKGDLFMGNEGISNRGALMGDFGEQAISKAISKEVTKKETKKELVSCDIEDYLLEDPDIYNQKWFVLSYLLPDKTSNELSTPMIKVRGVYRTYEECEKRIEKLKIHDTYYNMYICEMCKWGGLFKEDDLKNMTDVDIKYRESVLNTMSKEYQENKDKADEEFETRTRLAKNKARFDGTKEGQKILAEQSESREAIENRIKFAQDQLKELEDRSKELNEILSMSKEQLNIAPSSSTD